LKEKTPSAQVKAGEKKWFEGSGLSDEINNKCGSSILTNDLNKILGKTIQDKLPSIRAIMSDRE